MGDSKTFTGHGIEKKLDKRWPDAKSGQVVLYKNRRYKKWFIPGEMSADGKRVVKWLSGWEMIGDRGHVNVGGVKG